MTSGHRSQGETAPHDVRSQGETAPHDVRSQVTGGDSTP